eukprot:Skav212413  [mRNA]  locus=scaffold202:1869:2900:- [translate_table: standard]
MAFIFREVLSEFAGAFRRVYFAIMGGQNLKTFQDVFRGHELLQAVQKPKQPIFDADQIFSKLTSKTRKLICPYVGCCRDTWMLGCLSSKCSDSFHPAVCHCSQKSEQGKHQRWHCELYTHRGLCPRGALCAQREVHSHSLVAMHEAIPCPEWASCPNREEEHEMQFRHPTLCPNMTGMVIPDQCRKSAEHMQRYRHPDVSQRCQETICFEWMDERHLQCHHRLKGKGAKGVKQMCSFMNCSRKCNPEHIRAFLHIHIPRCKSEGCQSRDPDHLDSFFHEGSKRRFNERCKYGRRCRDLGLEHHRNYRHEATYLKKINCPAYSLRPFYTFINFADNLKACDGYD